MIPGQTDRARRVCRENVIDDAIMARKLAADARFVWPHPQAWRRRNVANTVHKSSS